jgi:hypothetical protein
MRRNVFDPLEPTKDPRCYIVINYCVRAVQEDRTDYRRLRNLTNDLIAQQSGPTNRQFAAIHTALLSRQRLVVLRENLLPYTKSSMPRKESIPGDYMSLQIFFRTLNQYPWLFPDGLQKFRTAALERANILPQSEANTEGEQLDRLRIQLEALHRHFLAKEKELIAASEYFPPA